MTKTGTSWIGIRSVVGFAFVVALSWGSTAALNKLYSFGGHPVRDERLNPVLVGAYTPVPADAHLYVTLHCPAFTGQSTFEIRDGVVTTGGPSVKVQAMFASQLPHEGDYQLYIRPIKGRGFVRVMQNPSPNNGYAGRVMVSDPYLGGSDYKFEIWSQGLP